MIYMGVKLFTMLETASKKAALLSMDEVKPIPKVTLNCLDTLED